MPGSQTLAVELLAGTRELLAAHARELPQRDDLCGAFCGALALRAAGVLGADGRELDQDDVALAAGSLISPARAGGVLPHGEGGRRDYRLSLPLIEDSDLSGTTAAGVVEAIEQLGGGALAAIPCAGPWSEAALDALFDAASSLARPVTLIANLATHHLWGGRPSLAQLLAYLLEGEPRGPAPDWRVGHFACVVARVRGPRGCLFALADTYPALGHGGVHLQPRERLAAAIARRDMPAGGVIAVSALEDAPAIRSAALAAGLRERAWDNGTASVKQETLP
ncbi:MAG TPA: hypothetical protein VL979_14560 [Solirubrobacteraceae bacterium]|nr:hypothetical protein [Solirubrobacteraceae bacterium]